MRKRLKIIASLVVVGIFGTMTGYGSMKYSRETYALYAVSNEVYCVVCESQFSVGPTEYTIEGTRNPSKLVQQKFELLRFNLQTEDKRITAVSVLLGVLKTETPNRVEVPHGTHLIIRHWQERGSVLKRYAAVWDSKTQADLKFDLNHVIAFDRAFEHAVVPWQDKVAVVKISSLQTDSTALEIKTNWNPVLNFSKEAYHHALLSRDGSALIFFPEGSSRLCCNVMVFGKKDSRQIDLPAGLSWNDVIDAEVINGELIFVTRNLGSDGDSYQITDSSWKVLANLPNGSGWCRPIWDVDGKRLVFQELYPAVYSVKTPIKFRVWDYQANKEIELKVQ